MTESTLRAGLLTQCGFEVQSLADGRAALEVIRGSSVDLAIVDLGLPGLDGMQLISQLRQQRLGLPVLVITARDELDDKIAGLEAGADDYLVKPFELPELVARVRALLRREHADRAGEIRIGALRMRLGEPRVFLSDTATDLTPRAFALLELLAQRAGRVVRRDSIATRLAKGDDVPSDTAIEVLVHRLRRRLEPHGLRVRTLRGFGYLLEVGEDD